MRRPILLLLLGAALLAILNLVYEASGGDPVAAAMRTQVDSSFGRRAIVIGSSASRGIDLQALCLDGGRYSYALDLFEAEAVGRLVLSRPSPPGLWFVTLSPTAELIEETTHNRRATYRMLAGFGDRRLIGGDWQRSLLAQIVPVLGEGPAMWQRLRVSLGIAAEAPGPSEAHDMRRSLDPAEAQAQAASWAASRRETVRTMTYYGGDIPPRSLQALRALDSAVRASGGRMIVVILPVTRELHVAMTRAMPVEMEDFGRRVAELRAAGLMVLDHLQDPAIAGRHHLFSDNLHLNEQGSLLFADRLRESLAHTGEAVGEHAVCQKKVAF